MAATIVSTHERATAAERILRAAVALFRERGYHGSSMRTLARALRVAGKVDPVFVDSVDGLPEAVLAQARGGDVVIVMGAGSIGNVAPRVVELGGGSP